MLDRKCPTFLLASPEPALLAAIEPVLLAAGSRVEVVLSAQAALASMTATAPPGLALLDANLPGMEMGQLLAGVRSHENGKRFPIVLISDTVTGEWIERLSEGVIDDLILCSAEPSYWQLRLDLVWRAYRVTHELDVLRESAAINAQLDPLTGVYNREALLAMLFRETDRVQRLKSSMCLLLFDIDDFGHWNSRLGMGRPGMDEFLVALPGCGKLNAAMLAERVRLGVFSIPFHVAGESIRLSACFGVAESQGRSPVVVLREAEQALGWAKEAGPESIQCFGENQHPAPAPVLFFSPTSGDELLAW